VLLLNLLVIYNFFKRSVGESLEVSEIENENELGDSVWCVIEQPTNEFPTLSHHEKGLKEGKGIESRPSFLVREGDR
jgi:hypothetical protein